MNIGPWIAGDKAYPIRQWLIRPFSKSGHDDHTRFNRTLSKGRVVIENAFGILKNRWQILRDLNVRLQDAPMVTLACCALHNLCILQREESNMKTFLMT